MHHRAKDITGLKCGSLTALSYAGSDGKKSLWNVSCECGRIVVLPASEMDKNKLRSCGCQRGRIISEQRTTHGMSYSRPFGIWKGMRDRCHRATDPAWANYGGRGIAVCEEWRHSFETFWRDMQDGYGEKLSIDRKDNDQGYSKENCRWVTAKEQGRNTRVNRVIETPWGRMCVSEAAERSGIGVTTLLYRIGVGLVSPQLFVPPDATNRFMTY